MWAQSKAEKSTWFTACGGIDGHKRFQVNKKRAAEGQDLKYLVANAIKEFLKKNNQEKYTDYYDSWSEEEMDNFTLKNVPII